MNVPIDAEAIGVKLIELGWTQAELAEEAKLSKRAVEGILSRGTAALESLHRIANVLEMDVSAIRGVGSATFPAPPRGGLEPLAEASLKPPDAADVFISYSSRDRARILGIAHELGRMGVSCWLDREKIPGAKSYGPEIVAGIKACKVLLVCCSAAFMRSKNVKQEIQLGWKYDRPYLPLLLEFVSYPEQLEYWLEGWQWSGKPGREHLVAIVSKQPLRTDWLPADTRLPAKTLTEADVAQLLQALQELPVTDWIALSTYFDVIP